ncbi:hypothetical protein [Maricaulis sp.]|uniref:hypothetical protein n=1 Tax=Maricaulis sp. TaxID=1486257 RepID=UPI002607770F|nr:hypothetical protein [Maricaulis sp.]MDF1770278.1 hypothetical protein [Maricaulis sp.]
MILSRITKALKDQNWLAVAIEFVIVILGVAIGFQVTGWNAARQDARLEHAYLERLADELDEVRDSLEDTSGDLDDARDRAERFLVALEAGDTDTMQADAIGLVVITRVSQVQVQTAAMHELISSGRLGLIRNEELRAALASLPLVEADSHSVFDQLKAQQVDIVAELRPHLRVAMQDYQIASITLADSITDDTDRIANSLSYSIYINRAAALFVAVLANEVDELHGLVLAELGEPDPTDSGDSR